MRCQNDRRRRQDTGKTRRITAFLLAICFASTLLAGQEEPGGPATPRTSPPLLKLPSEKTAFILSLIGTAVAASFTFITMNRRTNDVIDESALLENLSYLSMFAGPSLGSFYGGCWARGLLMTGSRVAVTFALGFTALIQVLEGEERYSRGLDYTFWGFMAATAAFELATVKKAVHRRNAGRMARRDMKLALIPFALPKGAGVRVQMSF